MLNFYKRLLAVRKQTPALISGNYTPLQEENEAVFCFLRSTNEQQCLVALNFSGEEQPIAFNKVQIARPIFSSAGHFAERELAAFKLAPYEVFITNLQCQNNSTGSRVLPDS